MFTDGNMPRIPGDEICNYTLGYLPCFDGSCFVTSQRCDGVRQCTDGADEMGCELINSNTLRSKKYPNNNFQKIT